MRPRGAEERWIDLNADAGEGFDDAGLLEYVTSVNVSCGGHVGSSETIARTVALAAQHRRLAAQVRLLEGAAASAS